MPWRKKWIDPGKFEGSEEELRKAVARRAYEVWVSEVSEYHIFSIVRSTKWIGAFAI